MVNNSTNINKMNNSHSPQLIEQKKKNTRCCKSWFWIGTDKESSTSIWLVICNFIIKGPLVVVIAWYLDLQLPVQSVPIMIKVVSSNLVHGEV